jgi:hypothetical protein
MGVNKRQIIENELIPKSWSTNKCKKTGCPNTYLVNPFAKPDNDLGYCDSCYEEVFKK